MTAVAVTGVVKMGANRMDSRPWRAWSPVVRQGTNGEVITTRGKEFPVRVVAGQFSAMLEPGVMLLENPDGKQYTVTIPAEGGDLWDIIDDAVAFPPETSAEALAAAVTGYLEDNPVVNVLAEGITDSGAAGRAAVQADTAAELREAAGASATGEAVLTGDAAAGRTALGAAGADQVDDIAETVRRGDPWWERVFAAPSEVPTITANTATQIGAGTLYAPTADYHYDPYFRYDGCHAVTTSAPGVTVTTAPEYVIPEVITDAQDIEGVFRSGRTGTDVIGVRMIVDGKMSHIDMERFDAVSGTVYFYRHQFASQKVRHLKFEVDGQNRFDGVRVGTHTVLQRPKGPHQFRHTAIGDSLQNGGPNYHIGAPESGDFFYMRYESHSRFQAALMGCDSYINLGAGGTGWGDNVPLDPFSNRIDTALAGYPHVLGFYGSRNDIGEESQILDAMDAGLARVEDVPFVLVCGPQQAGYTALNELVRQGTVMGGRFWIDVDGVAAAPASNPTGHPTLQEQKDLARAAHDQIDVPRIVSGVEAVNAVRQPVTVEVTTDPVSPIVDGTEVTITAAVTAPITPVGKVQFYDGVTPLGSAVTVTAGAAEYVTSALSVAAHPLTAKFLPTNPRVFKPATSPVLTLNVSDNLGVIDTFNRADGAVGNSENGKPWQAGGYTGFAIDGNTLANPTASASPKYIYIDCDTPWGDYEYTVAGTYNADLRICLFWASLTDHVFLNNGGGSNNWILYKRIGGTATALGTGSTGSSWTAGDVIRLEVRPGATATQANITVKKNAVTITGLALTNAELSTLATNTNLAIGFTTASYVCKIDAVSMVAAV